MERAMKRLGFTESARDEWTLKDTESETVFHVYGVGRTEYACDSYYLDIDKTPYELWSEPEESKLGTAFEIIRWILESQNSGVDCASAAHQIAREID